MAVNTTSGFIQWVVEGTLVVDSEFVEVKTLKSRPRDLSEKIILGSRGRARARALKVTNLDIFSSFLPLENMVNMT